MIDPAGGGGGGTGVLAAAGHSPFGVQPLPSLTQRCGGLGRQQPTWWEKQWDKLGTPGSEAKPVRSLSGRAGEGGAWEEMQLCSLGSYR